MSTMYDFSTNQMRELRQAMHGVHVISMFTRDEFPVKLVRSKENLAIGQQDCEMI
jgi:hypothetical protein